MASSPVILHAQELTLSGDTISEVHVRGHRVNTYLLDNLPGATLIDLRMMDDMPHILGNADPMHYAQLLPGVQTNSEYDAGLHVQGCDNAHNMVSINGVPVYNVSHLLGFFSIFNTPHFATMHIVKSPARSALANRLGGFIDIATSDSVRSKVGGDLSVGPISSQGTLRLPIGSKSQLTVSGRLAYINLLYGRWMRLESEVMHYSFDDYNLTWLYKPNEHHALSLDFYHGGDRASYDDTDYDLDTRLRWGNTMLALHAKSCWGDTRLNQTLYFTDCYNKFGLELAKTTINIPSGITDFGYQADIAHGALSAGVQIIAHSIRPQTPNISGMYYVEPSEQQRQHTLEASLYADYTLTRGAVSYAMGLRASCYRYGHYRRVVADPAASVVWDAGKAGTFSLRSSIKHQFLHRSGISDMGLPTEFWFSADQQFPAQYAYTASLGYETYLFNKMLHVSFETYYKRLYHQLEYSGNVLDVLYSTYDLHSMLLQGHGYNYGINVQVEKRKGKLTGWVSYSLGRAMRQFDDPRYNGWYPANHERIHELNAVATYRLGKRWSLGGTFVFASGTPFTAPRKFYLLNETMVSVFGEHNAQRLNPYMRLDLSVNYDFRHRGERRSGINFSLYNATMHANDIYYRLKIYKEGIAAKPFRFALLIMPSVNYYYHF